MSEYPRMEAAPAAPVYRAGKVGGTFSITFAGPPWWRPLRRRRWLAAERERARRDALVAAGFVPFFVGEDDAADRWARGYEDRIRRERWARRQRLDDALRLRQCMDGHERINPATWEVIAGCP